MRSQHTISLNSPSLENFLTESVAYNPQDAFDVLAGHQDNGINHLSRGDSRWLNNSNESDTVFFDPYPHEKRIAYGSRIAQERLILGILRRESAIL